MGLNVFIIAGEVSGDKLGGALMAGLNAATVVTYQGVGGPLMQAQGLKSQFPMEELSVMGLAEILPKYRALKARIRETAEAVIAAQPDVLITIDSPDFCLRVARLVKAASDVRVVHYVAPTVWAWRAGRAEKMARHVDQVLALFPFEPPFMETAGMRCDFVGHPVVAEPVASPEQAVAFREAHRVKGPLILALPGSRRGEVARLAERFGQAISAVVAKHPDARVVLPCAGPVAQLVSELTADWPVRPVLIDPNDKDGKTAAFRAADVALAASGTVSLELAASETPMVIAYDMAWLSRMIIGRMLKVDTVTLVNLVSDTRVVPEFIGKKCIASDIAQGVLDVLDHPQSQIAAMRLTMQRLGKDGAAPGARAAAAVLSGLAVQNDKSSGE